MLGISAACADSARYPWLIIGERYTRNFSVTTPCTSTEERLGEGLRRIMSDSLKAKEKLQAQAFATQTSPNGVHLGRIICDRTTR
jgi:hypothetical protein